MSPSRKVHRQQARLGKQMADLWLAAPQVVMSRTSAMPAAGTLPTARQLGEMQRMGTEKVDAFVESWTAMSLQAMTWPWQVAAVGSKLLGDAWLRPHTLLSPWSPGTAWATQVQSSWLDVALKGVAPVRRRAVANARRLKRG